MLAIIACGNPVRSDDGVGSHVLQVLRGDAAVTQREDVRLLDAGTDGMAVMYEARGCDALLLVDACRSGEPAGAIFEVPGREFDDRPPQGQNLHAFRWDHALYAGRRIYAEDFPEDVTVLLVEVENIAPGLELSETVRRAAGQVVARIQQKIAALPAVTSATTVKIEAATVQVPAALYQRYLQGVECVAPLADDSEGRKLWLLPLQNEAGGCLLKQRNAAGDRALQLQAFFRDRGWNEMLSAECDVYWDAARAALCVELPEVEHVAIVI